MAEVPVYGTVHQMTRKEQTCCMVAAIVIVALIVGWHYLRNRKAVNQVATQSSIVQPHVAMPGFATDPNTIKAVALNGFQGSAQ